MGERTGGIMRRLFILLTVCALILAGCGGQSKQPITESQSVETISQVEETVSTEIEETEVVETAEVESTEESVQADAEESKVEPEPTTEPEKPQQEAEQSKPEETTPSQEEKPEPPVSTEDPTPASTEPEQPKEQPTEAPAEVETVAYDPYEVVSLATAKTKAYGKISIPEDLDNMLANGEITKEEYDEYYNHGKILYRTVYFTDGLCHELLQYCMEIDCSAGVIFCGKENGRAITPGAVWKSLKYIAKQVDVPETIVYPHSFRHLFAKEYMSVVSET